MLWDGCVQIPEDTDILVNATSIGFQDDAKRIFSIKTARRIW